jgi:hypothetical protein
LGELLATVRRTLLLLIAGALVLSVAPLPAVAKKKSAAPTNRPPKKKPAKKPRPTRLWYRMSVTADGQYRTLVTPGANERGSTLDQNMSWSARSRTAFILYRSDLAHPGTGKRIPGYRFSAGVAGLMQSMDVTDTDFVPTCTPSIRAFRQTAPVGVQGVVSGYLPDDGEEATLDADQVRSQPSSPPGRSDSGVNSWSGYRCTNASGQVYSEVAPPPDSAGSAYIPMFCGYAPGYVNARFAVKGRVRYGRPFTVSVHCEAWWDAAVAGRIGSRRTIDYELRFTPCPRGGRTTKGC